MNDNEIKLFRNVNCRECGGIMRFAEGINEKSCICYNCSHIQLNYVGNQCYAHYDDDPSGASGSWDIVIRLIEETV